MTLSRSKNRSAKNSRLPMAMLAIGVILFGIDNLFYEFYRPEFSSNGSFQNVLVFTSLLIIVAAAIAVTSSASYYIQTRREIAIAESDSEVQWSLGSILSGAFFERRKIMLSATLVYAIFFAFLDAIFVYQPNVDFATAYVVNGPTWRVVMCCGPPGYVPVGLLYLPSIHFGLQLIPLSLMLMILVSTLVGLNVTLLHQSYSLSRPARSSRGFFGSVAGAGLGLFVGCPTCAATFLLSMVAGTGSLAFAGLVFAYQPLIAAITIPLLLFSVLWQANSIKTMLRGCAPKTDKMKVQI